MKKFKAGDKVRCVRSDYSAGCSKYPGDTLEVTEVTSWQHNTFIAGEFCGDNDYWELLPSRPDPLVYLKEHLESLPAYSGEYAFADQMLEDVYGLRRKVITKITEEAIYEDIT